MTGQAVADPVVPSADLPVAPTDRSRDTPTVESSVVRCDPTSSGVDWDTTLVLDFLNTIETPDVDLLDEERSWRAWVAARGLSDPEPVDLARSVRDGLRASITAGPEVVGLPDQFTGAAIAVELIDGVPRLRAEGGLGAVLVAAARMAIHGHWSRLKICPAEDCRWAFFDRSRNRSRTWCSMRVCGNREKARAWRRRHG